MIKLKNILTLFFVSVAVGSLLRSLCFIYTTEAATGFLISRMKPLGSALIITCFAIAACVFIFSLFLKLKPNGNRPASPMLSGAALCLSVALCVDLIRNFFVNSGITWQFVLKDFFGSIKTVLFNNNVTWQFALKEFFGFLTVAALIIYGVATFMKIKFPKLILCLPVIFTVFQTIEIFTAYATLSLIAEHLYDLMVLCMLLLFLLNFSKFENGIKIKHKGMLLASSLCASLLCLSSFISRTATVLFGFSNRLHGNNPLSISLLFFGIFAFAYAIDIYNKQNITDTDL